MRLAEVDGTRAALIRFIGTIARKVTVLHEGAVLAEGPLAAVQDDPRVIEVYLGR